MLTSGILFENKHLLEESIKKAGEHHIGLSITTVEMIGGNTRIPFVQEIIKSVYNMEPFATLYANEVISRGCGLLVSAQSLKPSQLNFTQII